MASGNSQEIISYKQKAMEKMINNETLVSAINAKSVSGSLLEPDELYYTHIFPYSYIPDTIDTAGSYINIEVSMPNVSTANYFFKDVLITITIVCHQDVMRMTSDEPLGATGATRLDYLSVLIDKLFNRERGIGRGELELVSNIEGAIDPVHRCRIMRFKTQDIVDPACR